jgi:hypothetical protein
MNSKLVKNWGVYVVTPMAALVVGGASLFFLSAKIPLTSETISTAVNAATDDSRIRNMNQEQLADLRRKKNQFDELTEAERVELRELHTALQLHPDRERLTSVMKLYYEWYKMLDSNDQTRVSSKVNLAERVTLIHEMRKKQAEQSSPFPDKDLKAFSEWLEEIASNNVEDIRTEFAIYTKENQRRFEENHRRSIGNSRSSDGNESRGDKEEEILPRVMLRRLLVSDLAIGGRGGGSRNRGNEYLKSIITDSDYNVLISRLTPESQLRFQETPENPNGKMRALRVLVFRPYATEVELQQFYVSELTAQQRDELDKMSPEWMNRQLRSLFGMKQMGIDIKNVPLPFRSRN